MATEAGVVSPHKEGEPMQRLIEVRVLVAIVTLSEELNFTRAAMRLGITQPGLSRRVSFATLQGSR
jgi:hypothetical protein